MRFGIHHSSWLDGPDSAETFEAVKAKAAATLTNTAGLGGTAGMRKSRPGKVATSVSRVDAERRADPHE